jgi:azurin
MEVDGKAEYRTLPLTLECRAKLNGSKGYNILVANDPKSSADHWELYTHAGSGQLALYLPGRGGDFKTTVNICDGNWHQVAATVEEARVQLFIDGKSVLDRPAQPRRGEPQPGALAFGQLVGGSIGCDGVIDDVRLSKGVREVVKLLDKPLTRDEQTLGLWSFDDLPEPVKAAAFEYDYAPLHPEQWPHKDHPLNKHRIYDFYAKEAMHFMRQQPVPALLPEYPGLEGGTFGHWGTQNDQTTWKDGRWNDTDIGNLMAGVFHGAGKTIPKGVAVRCGDNGELSACFDPLTLSYPVVWKNGFVSFSDARHGFMNGTTMKGDLVRKETIDGTDGPAVYHGYYRNGKRVIFSYALEGKEYLDSPWTENRAFVEIRDAAATHPLRDLCKGGPAQWPQWIETKGELGAAKPYALDTLTLPVNNPWKTLFFVSGHDSFANGDAAICTMTGEVWLCRGIDETLQHLRWKRYATGLHQPLGLKIIKEKIYVQGRDQITCLHDLNGDDEADFYECVTNVQTTSAGGHDFITGLEQDSEGCYIIASGNQGVCRIKVKQTLLSVSDNAPSQTGVSSSRLEVLATGFRNPNGLGLAKDGTITTSVQEGDWTPASAICQIKPGGFYGHGGPKDGQKVELPLMYLPRGLDNSCGGQCFTETDRWGPLGGQLIHFSPGAANHFLILRQQIGDTWQGAALQLPGDFRSGAQTGRINAKDGQLYVSGMFGWGTYAPDDGCFQRVRYTGGPAHLPVAFEARNNGVLLTFSDALDKDVAANKASHFAQSWNYFYSRAYGSPEFSVRHPQQHGHDVETIASAHVLEDGKRLFLEIPEIAPAHTLHLHLTPAKGQERDLFISAFKLDEDFTQFPGYQHHDKAPLPSAATVASMMIPAPAKPNPWAKGNPGRAIKLEAALGLQYLQRQLTVKAGERISLTFKNPDVVPHNFVLIKPGKLQAIGDLANKLITDPNGLARHYVPESPDVLVYTDMTNAGSAFTINFDTPKEKGDHPYLCTFPGHWMVMNGVLKVE